jgi:SAM-dependent methyltransferase
MRPGRGRRGRQGPSARHPGRRAGRAPSARRVESGRSHGSDHSVDRAWTRDECVALLAATREIGLDPEGFWKRIELPIGAVVADIGAGAGRFAFPAAERVGPGGKVYAVDVSEDLVRLVSDEARRRRLPQLVALRSTPKKIPLADSTADVVLLANVLHDVSSPTIRESVRILRPGGTLVNLDWEKRATPQGPPLEVRLSAEDARVRLEAEGLVARKRFRAGPMHYALTFAKPPSVRSRGSRRRAPL